MVICNYLLFHLYLLVYTLIKVYFKEYFCKISIVTSFIISSSGSKVIYGLFFPMSKKATVFVVDTVRSDQLPNLSALYNAERNNK